MGDNGDGAEDVVAERVVTVVVRVDQGAHRPGADGFHRLAQPERPAHGGHRVDDDGTVAALARRRCSGTTRPPRDVGINPVGDFRHTRSRPGMDARSAYCRHGSQLSAVVLDRRSRPVVGTVAGYARDRRLSPS